MLGIKVKAWHHLPIEAILVWFAVTFTTVQTFEVIKVWQASSLSFLKAFLGDRTA